MDTAPASQVEVRSGDGTVLAAEVQGQGSPLVLVHGTGVGKGDWMELPRLLAEHHTVWVYDRRGRDKSGDGPTWELEREIDDIRAVLAAAGEPGHLLGHSFGAMCAMEAVTAGVSPRSLVLYEPPIHVWRAAAAVERSVASLDKGDPEGTVDIFLTEVAGMPRDEFEKFRSTGKEWDATVERAPTIAREVQALARLGWQPGRFRSVTVPTLYIAGGLTEAPVYATQDEIAEALPQASHVTIPDQEHVAFAYDPEGFAQVVLEFTRPLDDRADGLRA